MSEFIPSRLLPLDVRPVSITVGGRYTRVLQIFWYLNPLFPTTSKSAALEYLLTWLTTTSCAHQSFTSLGTEIRNFPPSLSTLRISHTTKPSSTICSSTLRQTTTSKVDFGDGKSLVLAWTKEIPLSCWICTPIWEYSRLETLWPRDEMCTVFPPVAEPRSSTWRFTFCTENQRGSWSFWAQQQKCVDSRSSNYCISLSPSPRL